MNKKLSVFLFIVTVALIACEGKVNITETTYEPKLFIQGVLVPGEMPRIAIRRNFPLNDPLIEPAGCPAAFAATLTSLSLPLGEFA